MYPIELVSVATSPGTPDEVLVEELGGALRIRIGDPDVTVTGRHAYEIVYRVRGAMNGFPTHDELYWNAIGTDWRQDVGRATVTVRGPAPIVRVACFAGLAGSTAGCDRAEVVDGVAIFAQRDLPASTALTVAVALPPGTVASTEPILEERWSLDRAFARTPVTVGGAAGGTALVLVAVAVLAWRRGRDRRYRGSPIDQVMGGVEGQEQAVPLLERGEGPVGLPVVLAGVALAGASRWMPRRAARRTALARRVAGFRRVIETAEAHLARFAEQENVFTRYLPYAIVFGCTEKWAKAFASLGAEPTDTSWYVSSRPYGLRDLGERLDAFSMTTSGVIASTPAASGRSAFGGGRAGGGGGRAGGGAGGGGGGSW
ncbi:MAG: hypothetical protein KatS3mg014_1180 [Actinomycetota bacterium]|nr:MAG: hypothetical protein KatS3mg014_1180 [Actinomycetota bacterium]